MTSGSQQRGQNTTKSSTQSVQVTQLGWVTTRVLELAWQQGQWSIWVGNLVSKTLGMVCMGATVVDDLVFGGSCCW